MNRVVQNPTTGETVHETQYKQWLASREAAHVQHLIAVENKRFPAEFEASFKRVFGGDE